MTYIIKHDFEQLIPYYVGKINETEFQETYDPHSATQFKSRKEAEKWFNTYSSMAKYSRVVEYIDAIEEYSKWVRSGSVRRVLKCINTIKSRPYNNEPIDEIIDWWIYARLNEYEIKYEHYKTWPKLFQKSKHLFDIEAYCSDSDDEDLVYTFQIYTSRSGKFKEFEMELGRVLNKVTYKNEEGYLIFPIFDHYLSEHGNRVELCIHPETKKVRISCRYYDDDEFDSLKDAFEYMKEHRYYE